jgi:hypothetical protein
LENILSQNLEMIYLLPQFISLPFISLQRIIRKSNPVSFDVIYNIVQKYSNKNPLSETLLLLLNDIRLKNPTFSDCISILSSITTSPFCVQLSQLFSDFQQKFEYSKLNSILSKLLSDNQTIKNELTIIKNHQISQTIFSACQNGDLEIVKILIEKGIDIESRNNGVLFFYSNCTPFYVACENGHLNIFSFLYNKGANIHSKNDNNHKSPLEISAENHHLEIIEFLFDHGVSLSQIQLKKYPNIYKSCKKNSILGLVYHLKKSQFSDIDKPFKNIFLFIYFMVTFLFLFVVNLIIIFFVNIFLIMESISRLLIFYYQNNINISSLIKFQILTKITFSFEHDDILIQT